MCRNRIVFISWCSLFINKLTIILFRDGINQILVGISNNPIAVLVQFNGEVINFCCWVKD